MIKPDEFPHIRAIHIIKDNKMIFEQSRESISKTQLFPVGCIFKSFLAVLIGIAIYEGKIESIEDCVLDYFPHDEINDMYCNKQDEISYRLSWYKLKIKHALSKTTGIIWPSPKDPIPESMDKIMELRFENEPGTSFQYKPDPQIIVYLLEEVYKTEITKLFETKILSHFKLIDYRWDRERIEDMQVSIQMLDELGQLLLNKGVIGGTRLFSEDYYEQMIHEYSKGGFPECTSYGLGFWIESRSEIPYFYASGFGGQYLIVIPQKNTSISILSDMDRPHPENKTIVELVL